MIAPKEAPFLPDFGSDVYSLLFELADGGADVILEQEIRRTIAFNEPRVELQDVRVDSNIDANGVSVRVEYKIIGMQDIFTFDQILRPTN